MNWEQKYGPQRRFQSLLLDLSRDIIDGVQRYAGRKTFVVEATPGGGKTRAYSQFYHELLDSGFCDQVVVVVPRDSLRSQVAQGVVDGNYLFRGLIDDPKHIKTGQQSLLQRAGFVTTYQAIAAQPGAWLKRTKRFRTLLIPDEGHHLAEKAIDETSAEGVAWWNAIRPIAEAAHTILVGTGTLFRDDGQRIALVPYDSDNKPIADVRYTRREALLEKAILPINFYRLDGDVIYDSRGIKEVTLSTARRSQRSGALRAFLESPDVCDAIVLGRLAEWKAFRRDVYRSKAIVVARNQKMAKRLAELVRARMGVGVALAISDDPNSKRALRMFREGNGEVLITVAMAHEGLDVKDATHLICLTTVRSAPWIEQAFGRVTRFDPACGLPWESQCAHIYVPDDRDMRVIIDDLMTEQLRAVKEREERSGRGDHRIHPMATFRSIEASLGAVRFGTVDGILSDRQSAAIAAVHKEYGDTRTWSHLQVLRLAVGLGHLQPSEIPVVNGAHHVPVESAAP